MALSTADVAESFLRNRSALQRDLVGRLARVNGALDQWSAYDANALLRPAERREVRRPTMTREALEGLRQLLMEELAHLER
jgi:hypothetical protein